MTISQFEQRLQEVGASEREVELISAMVFHCGWASAPATKLTNKQRKDILTLIGARREEDEINARVENDLRNQHITAFGK